MKYYLITGKTPEILGRPARPAIPAMTVEEPGGIQRHIPEVPAAPAVDPVPSQDIRILIGESNPFDVSGKPFKPQFHQDFGIATPDSWKRLIIIYGQRITHEYFVTKEGLRQDLQSEVIPPSHLFALLNDGFVKEGRTDGKHDKIVYWKQKGRIEDDTGKTYTADEMIKILEGK